jgi:hypothetical protein
MIVRASIFLLLGAIVNVTVAWALALWVKPIERDIACLIRRDLSPVTEPECRDWWAKHAPSPEWGELFATHVDSCPGVEKTVMWSDIPGEDGITARYHVERLRYGLPLLFMEGSIAWERDSPSFVTQNTLFVSIGQGGIPLHPLWPGFAINTIFYALLLWPLVAAPGFVRRRLRRRRGLCPGCAYPIGTSDVCTECGRDLPERRGA